MSFAHVMTQTKAPFFVRASSLGLAVFAAVVSACDDSAAAVRDSGPDANVRADSGASLPMCKPTRAFNRSVVIFDSASGMEVGGNTVLPIHGTVVLSGHGIPHEAANLLAGWKESETRWIRIEDNARSWTVATRIFPTFGVTTGSTVDLEYFFESPESGQTRWGLEIREGASLAFYYAAAESPDRLRVPDGVKITRRNPLCMGADNCLSWLEYELEMSIDGGESVTLGTGETGVRGDYLFQNLWDAQEVGGASQCDDASLADTVVVIARMLADSEMDAGPENDGGR
jgi:hypothetical protein